MECQGPLRLSRPEERRTSLGACFLPLTLDELARSILCWAIVLVCHGLHSGLSLECRKRMNLN